MTDRESHDGSEQPIQPEKGEHTEGFRQSPQMQTLGQLAGNAAHDFNNLLGAIIGSFELIRRTRGDPARVHALAEAGLLVAERGAKLTSQLLAFSRNQPIEPAPVNVAAMLEGMDAILALAVGPRIPIKFDIACGSRVVVADRTQLEMAILNLAINARDAMPEGGRLAIVASLCVGRDHASLPGECVELLVRDTGSGMTPDVAARAFEPFFTTKDIGTGTGLGLSQVHAVARQAGGSVQIESQPGSGTTVRLLLPCAEAPHAGAPAEPAPPDRPAPGPATAPATVLLVDDDQDLRFVLATTLRDLGYEVLDAADGETGLRLLEQHAPDLLVADFTLPGMSGAELARSARRLRPDLPIIVASGYAEALDFDPALAPRPRVLHKPFRIGELRAAIDAALGL